MAASVETWIDNLCKVMAVTDGRGGTVRSYLVFEKNELPLAVSPEMIPCAVSYPGEVEVEYSTGGPTLFFWSGQTEFHLTRDVKPSNIPYILPFFGRIIAACAQNMRLSSTVEMFTILQNTPGAMQYATYRQMREGVLVDDHQGIVVKWTVKQNVSGQYTVSA